MSACTGKRRFATEIDAKIALSRIDRAGDDQDRQKVPSRAYRCKSCKGWHLTSMPLGKAEGGDL